MARSAARSPGCRRPPAPPIRSFVAAAALAGALSPEGRLLAQGHDHAAPAAPPSFGTWTPGTWTISLHGAAFGMYVDQFTKRGDNQLALTDWEMLMAMRPLAGGTLHLRAMTSIEPFVLGGSGYPELLQNGGSYLHSPIHDRKHPHDALMELAAKYEHPVTSAIGVSFYAGAAGEPALGPVAYMHRPSAAGDPIAPIGHHWQDTNHQSFGVVTFGLSTRTLKLEGSAFNPREADENHLVVDYRDAKLDSYAGRITWTATPSVTASAWMGFLNSHDRLDPTMRMHRYGASVATETRGPGGGRWASTFVWGMNLHHHGGSSHALIHGAAGASPHHPSHSLLAESNLEVGSRSALFARVERIQINGGELGFSGGDLTTLYEVRSVVLGASRRILSMGTAQFSLGARGAVNFIPETLLATYGTRTPAGYAVYAQLRPRVR